MAQSKNFSNVDRYVLLQASLHCFPLLDAEGAGKFPHLWLRDQVCLVAKDRWVFQEREFPTNFAVSIVSTVTMRDQNMMNGIQNLDFIRKKKNLTGHTRLQIVLWLHERVGSMSLKKAIKNLMRGCEDVFGMDKNELKALYEDFVLNEGERNILTSYLSNNKEYCEQLKRMRSSYDPQEVLKFYVELSRIHLYFQEMKDLRESVLVWFSEETVSNFLRVNTNLEPEVDMFQTLGIPDDFFEV